MRRAKALVKCDLIYNLSWSHFHQNTIDEKKNNKRRFTEAIMQNNYHRVLHIYILVIQHFTGVPSGYVGTFGLQIFVLPLEPYTTLQENVKYPQVELLV